MDLHILIIPALGAFVGILMGLSGAGGGILSVPLLVFFVHLPMAEASPIALCAIALSATVGAIIGLKEKVLRYKAAIFMSIFGLIMSPIGLWVANKMPNAPLLLLFSAILIFVSARLYIQAHKTINGTLPTSATPPPCQLDLSISKLIWTVPCARSLMYAGLTAGFLSGLLGVGGGFVIVPSLKKFTDLPMKSIVATSLGVLAIVSSGGALVSLASGNLNVEIAILFALGSLMGLVFGKLMEKKISGTRVQQIFAIFTFLVALNLIYKAV
ncbi:sulfite exporter TauE/SafE family protein [Polynucleobacter paneuropaeus]|uniref:Probable membrane transporter protein n=1 Tax=Polynucleobacter paneuropaeus TaxID=2527775 RepID=A0A2Z4JV36_9BURK|nr:sulfite exporter TauE/SafE family protein [Polynucleobacter paneuropaeus]AWW50580.1 sulfite exporter TauE/SafE family protein [Polynucleobacter paneuropaeus]MBT8528978.1 sulfite exporter TauE/SafE family protein [Polynucleobacter paneuropaeus]MBT8558500.1 sulfite exporter TauE/SafE family protein [Polynucleobacter paneuropaeus]MBT8563599.1 sulfite exporter TauE/SafE family protein [Polynucleobacter paneuropaeus]QWD09042.1 sulfite exporter TauE/SafE family protein [Polynucleobacter paneuropa